MTRTVLITGTSSGLGRHAVDKFLAEGWNVVATLRDPARWDGAPHDRLLVRALDVRDEASAAAAVTAATDRFGRLDVLVNNAGIGLVSVFESTPAEVVEEVFDTNVFAPMRLIRAALPVFHAQGGGRIVNVTSTSVTLPDPLQSVYASSKAALHNFSEGLSYELAERDIVVKVVEPGFMPTTGFAGQTRDRSLAVPVPEAYGPFFQKQVSRFDAELPTGYFATADDAAEAVFAAATDTTDRLRFRAGGDSEDAARARHQPEAEFETWRRAQVTQL